jgi:hypothetical protein
MLGFPQQKKNQMKKNRMQEQSGGFGCFLALDHHWADWAETKRS